MTGSSKAAKRLQNAVCGTISTEEKTASCNRRGHEEPLSPDAAQGSTWRLRPALLQVILAWITTAIIIAILLSFNNSGAERLLAKFPTCDRSATARLSASFPEAVRPFLSCEALILELALLLCVHWCNVFGLFWSKWGRERLHNVVMATVLVTIGMMLAGPLVIDPVTLFLVAVPLILDSVMAFFLAADAFTARS